MGRGELHQVRKAIKRIRAPGDQPSVSATTLEWFECDLCKGDIPKNSLTQCQYCGRWICKGSCWNQKFLTCTACASVIKIAQHPEHPKNPQKASPFTDLVERLKGQQHHK